MSDAGFQRSRRFEVFSRLVALFATQGLHTEAATRNAASIMPGKSKWRRIVHPARCQCVKRSDPCLLRHSLAFCKRHRAYICQECGIPDRQLRGKAA
jgi:hypothetical protein